MWFGFTFYHHGYTIICIDQVGFLAMPRWNCMVGYPDHHRNLLTMRSIISCICEYSLMLNYDLLWEHFIFIPTFGASRSKIDPGQNATSKIFVKHTLLNHKGGLMVWAKWVSPVSMGKVAFEQDAFKLQGENFILMLIFSSPTVGTVCKGTVTVLWALWPPHLEKKIQLAVHACEEVGFTPHSTCSHAKTQLQRIQFFI